MYVQAERGSNPLATCLRLGCSNVSMVLIGTNSFIPISIAMDSILRKCSCKVVFQTREAIYSCQSLLLSTIVLSDIQLEHTHRNTLLVA